MDDEMTHAVLARFEDLEARVQALEGGPTEDTEEEEVETTDEEPAPTRRGGRRRSFDEPVVVESTESTEGTE